jgi:hypothetical protein
MEYIWGKDLLQIQNRIRKLKQMMPVQMACFCIAKVLEGLDYAHRKRDPLGRPLEIVHRDCSPQNVLISYEGEVKVIDFGIAKATSRNSRTMAGVLKGKFGYMSPEQVRGLPLDRRSDIFALGTMLYECLTGERLFQGETDFSTLEKVRNVDIQPPRAVNPNIPESVEKVILKALAKDVDDRYQWCSEMLADLQAYLMSQDVVTTAKSLSSWLKEIFAQEIDRERQQLEQYKRVGRDGLIAGVPAAEAKLDVVEHLGEAGAPEGDATMLGGPSFEEMEQGIGAAPDVSQSPASRKPSSPAPTNMPRGRQSDNENDSGDFGEEAPTEIFGDDPMAALAAAAAATPTPTPARKSGPTQAPNARDLQQPLGKVPPKAPPGRATTQRPETPVPMAASPSQPMVQSAPPSAPTMMAQSPFQQPGAQPFAGGPSYTPVGAQPQVAPMATPGALAIGSQAPAQGNPQAKTVLGVQAPPGLGNYGGGAMQQPQQPPQQQYGYSPTPGPMPQQQGYPQQGGWQPAQQQYPSNPGYPQQAYGSYGSQPMGALPVDQAQMGMTGPMVEGKKSTLGRDIGIGVGIAALVLVAFLVVKMFVLDKGSDGKDQAPSTISTVHLKMTAGITGRMFIDDKDSMTVEDGQDVPVNAGKHKIRIVGPVNACDTVVALEGGKTTTLDCVLAAPSGSNAAQAGSAAGPSAAVAHAGSAEAKGPEVKTPEVKQPEVKTPEVKQPEVKQPEVKTPEVPETKGSASTKTPEVKTETIKTTTKAPDTTHTTTTKAPDTSHTTTTTKAPDTTKQPDHTKTTDTATHAADTTAVDPSKGYLQVFSKPAAKILVDGVDSGMKTPISGHTLALTPGKHKVTFVIGDDRFTYPVTIKQGSTETMSKDLQ